MDSFIDMQDPNASSEPLHALLEASGMLLADVSAESVVSGMVGLARQVIKADAYAVWRTQDALNWKVIASSGLSPSYRTSLTTPALVIPELMVVEDVESSPLLRSYTETYRDEKICSMLVVPLRFRDSVPDGPNAGTITFYWRTPHRFESRDISYATALANLSSTALNLAELHEQNVREKKRLAFLAEASAVLASSLDYESTLDRVANIAVPGIADWCTVHILENGTPTRIVTAHADPAMIELSQKYNDQFPEIIREDRGLGFVFRTGKPEMIPEITDVMIAAAIQDPEQLAYLRRMGIRSSILVPLTSQDKVIGAIRLVAAGGDRRFNREDLQLAEDLALRASAAIENAQLHRAVIDRGNQLHLALSAAMVGTWTWDLVRNQPAWSEEWKALHGLPPETELNEQHGVALIHPEDRERVLSQLHAALESNADQFSVEHRSLHALGHPFWMHTRGRIDRNEDGKAVFVVGISIDVTERRHSEEALRKSERLATAGRLAATVAHEINNPLESIVNLVYLARNSSGLPEDASSFLATADEELTRIAQTVRQTLGFYRETVEPRDTDIARVAAETVAVYRPRIQSGSLTCELDVQPESRAMVIPGEMKQVIANLLTNAVDATAPGGHLRVSVQTVEANIVLSVSDNGSGIRGADVARLFEPFFTTKADIGTGLGLWVTKGIVEKHGGTIRIVSSTEPATHGTAVIVSLPSVATIAPELRKKSRPS